MAETTKHFPRALLLALLVGLAVANRPATAQTVTPPPATSPTPTVTAGPTTTPTVPADAHALLLQSLQNMRSQHSVRADGTMQTSGALHLHFTGDCSDLFTKFSEKTLTILSIRGRLWARGTYHHNGKTKHVGTHIIVIGSSKAGHIWVRQDSSGKWKKFQASADSPLFLGDFLYVCYPLLASQLPASQLTGSINAGQIQETVLNGSTVWKVSEKHRRNGVSGSSSIYLDRTSLYWLRFRESKTANSGGSTIQFNFSKYGDPVTIKPPR